MIRVLPAGLLVIAAAGIVMPQANASISAAATRSRTTTLCRYAQHITAIGRLGAQFIVRNDNFGDQRECLSNRNDWSNFTVTKSAAHTRGIEPVAYPNIFLGCSWDICSPRSGLPSQVGRLRSLVTSWYTVQPAVGRWSVSYDIWFNRTDRVFGQDDGAEIMIWLNARRLGPDRGPIVVLDHVRWHLTHWITGRDGTRWNYLQFRRVRPTDAVRQLSVQPFIRLAEHDRLLSKRWWLTGVEAGFEIWSGGVGLATKSFWARAWSG